MVLNALGGLIIAMFIFRNHHSHREKSKLLSHKNLENDYLSISVTLFTILLKISVFKYFKHLLGG